MTILIEMVGTVNGGVVQGLLGIGGNEFICSIVVATLGATILLAICRVLAGRRRV